MTVYEATTKYAADLLPLYHLYATKVQDLISSILRSNGITPHSVTSREKSVSSLREKINRIGKSYDNPLSEITDLAAVRVITYFPTDVDRIVPLLEGQFVIDWANSIDKRTSLDPSAFGYVSVHLVVQLAPPRCDLPEYSPFKDLRCEVQIRTILQHAWAEIEHDMIYKSSAEIPAELRRKFASLAALLEVADREFELLRREEGQIREKTRQAIAAGQLDVAINLDSLRFYLEKHHNEIVSEVNSQVKLSEFIRLLAKVGIENLSALHQVLSPAALQSADHELSAFQYPCRSPQNCMLRIIVPVGKSVGMTLEEIGTAVHCPGLSGEERTAYPARRTIRESDSGS